MVKAKSSEALLTVERCVLSDFKLNLFTGGVLPNMLMESRLALRIEVY